MDTKRKWYERRWVLWILFIIAPYIGILFIWKVRDIFSKKEKIALSIVFIFYLLVFIGDISNLKVSDIDNPNPLSASSEIVPDIPLSNDFEKAIWEIINNNEAKLTSIETFVDETSNKPRQFVLATVFCKNDEDVVNLIFDEIRNATTNNNKNDSVVIKFHDLQNIREGEDATMLLLATAYNDGTINMSATDISYNSARNKWIKEQFSEWDGSHKDLKKLILRILNDENSFKHIKTTYADISTEQQVHRVNEMLSNWGYNQQVEINDLLISTQFSAKNAFGGTVKNTAHCISRYSNGTITLIGVE